MGNFNLSLIAVTILSKPFDLLHKIDMSQERITQTIKEVLPKDIAAPRMLINSLLNEEPIKLCIALDTLEFTESFL